MSQYYEVKVSEMLGRELEMLQKATSQNKKLLVYATEDDLIVPARNKCLPELHLTDVAKSTKPAEVAYRFEFRLKNRTLVVKDRDWVW